MGWWVEEDERGSLAVGDECLDAVGSALEHIARAYEEDHHRKPKVGELERTLEFVLSGLAYNYFEDVSDVEVARIRIRLKKRPKTQRIASGDYFSVPLPGGGYGFGRIKGIFRESVLFIDLLDAYSDSLLTVAELKDRRVLFDALCGYLGLARWVWRVIGQGPVPGARGEMTKEEAWELVSRFGGRVRAPSGDLPNSLEEELRKRRRIPK